MDIGQFFLCHQDAGHLGVDLVVPAHELFLNVVLAAFCQAHGFEHGFIAAKIRDCRLVVYYIIRGHNEVGQLLPFHGAQRLKEPLKRLVAKGLVLRGFVPDQRHGTAQCLRGCSQPERLGERVVIVIVGQERPAILSRQGREFSFRAVIAQIDERRPHAFVSHLGSTAKGLEEQGLRVMAHLVLHGSEVRRIFPHKGRQLLTLLRACAVMQMVRHQDQRQNTYPVPAGRGTDERKTGKIVRNVVKQDLLPRGFLKTVVNRSWNKPSFLHILAARPNPRPHKVRTSLADHHPIG